MTRWQTHSLDAGRERCGECAPMATRTGEVSMMGRRWQEATSVVTGAMRPGVMREWVFEMAQHSQQQQHHLHMMGLLQRCEDWRTCVGEGIWWRPLSWWRVWRA